MRKLEYVMADLLDNYYILEDLVINDREQYLELHERLTMLIVSYSDYFRDELPRRDPDYYCTLAFNFFKYLPSYKKHKLLVSLIEKLTAELFRVTKFDRSIYESV